jgi:hypothetical protein
MNQKLFLFVMFCIPDDALVSFSVNGSEAYPCFTSSKMASSSSNRVLILQP